MSRAIAFSPDGLARFLQRMEQATAMAAIAADADPERAIWIPCAKTFFIPDQPTIVHGLRALELSGQLVPDLVQPQVFAPDRFRFTQMTSRGEATIHYRADWTVGRVLLNGRVADAATRQWLVTQL